MNSKTKKKHLKNIIDLQNQIMLLQHQNIIFHANYNYSYSAKIYENNIKIMDLRFQLIHLQKAD